MPLLIFTSISNSPILKIRPRTMLVPYPILLAYVQHGVGHYDAVGYTSDQIDKPAIAEQQLIKCKCGVNDKGRLARCCPNQTYQSRCPCLNAGKNCTAKCSCSNCNNPNGKQKTLSPIARRKRQKHFLQSKDTTSVNFMQKKGECITQGKWSHFENLLLVELISFMKKSQEPTAEIIHGVYNHCIDAIVSFKMNLPAGRKSLMAISTKLNQYSSLQTTFQNLLKHNYK